MPIKTAKEFKQDLLKKYGEIQALTEKAGDKPTKEQASQIQKAWGEYDQLKVHYDNAMHAEKAAEFAKEESDRAPTTFHGFRKTAPGEGDVVVDPKSWREMTVPTLVGRKTLRYNVPLATTHKDYGSAFDAYIRKGFLEMGPNDKKVLQEGSDPAGGFLVAPEWMGELIKKTATMAIIRNLARVVPVSSGMAHWPRVNYTSDDKYTSPIRLTWTGETPTSSTAHRVTDPVFGQLDIPVKTAMASLPISNDMLEDSGFDVFGMATDLMGEAFALGEDESFIEGNSLAKPTGFLFDVDGDGPSSIESSSSGSIDAADYIDLFYTLPAQYRLRAVWVMSSSTMAEAEKLTDTDGRYILSSLISGASLETPMFQILKGKQVQPDEFMPDVSSGNYPVAFGDFSGYIVVDRVGLAIQRLTERYAELNQTVLLARKRVGGLLAEPYKIKVIKVAS